MDLIDLHTITVTSGIVGYMGYIMALMKWFQIGLWTNG